MVWNLLIRSSLICSFAQIAQIKWATMSDSLRSLRTNERLRVNRSGPSCQKSDRERCAQVAHDKWANERSTCFFERIAHLLFRSQKKANWSKNLPKIVFLERFLNFFFYKTSDLLIPSGHLPKMSDVSESLRSITKNEQMSEWSNRSFFERIANSLIICSLFRKKRAIHSRKPMSEFPTLQVT